MDKQAELERLKSLREKIIAAMERAAEGAEISNYSFGDDNGNQSAHRRSPKELMQWLKKVDAEIGAVEQSLRGGGLHTFGMNRYGRGGL